MNDAREFDFEPELPFGDVPAVFPFVPAVFVDIPAVLCLHKDKISAPPTCTQTRPHSHFCLVLVRVSTGVIAGSFMGLLWLLEDLPGVLCHEDKSEPDSGSPSLLHISRQAGKGY